MIIPVTALKKFYLAHIHDHVSWGGFSVTIAILFVLSIFSVGIYIDFFGEIPQTKQLNLIQATELFPEIKPQILEALADDRKINTLEYHDIMTSIEDELLDKAYLK